MFLLYSQLEFFNINCKIPQVGKTQYLLLHLPLYEVTCDIHRSITGLVPENKDIRAV